MRKFESLYGNTSAVKHWWSRHLKPRSGVYQVVNKNTNKRYIGSTRNVRERLIAHYNNIKCNKHPNISGNVDDFFFGVIEYTDAYKDLEKVYIIIINDESLYNKQTYKTVSSIRRRGQRVFK